MKKVEHIDSKVENAFRKMNVKLSRSMCNKVFDDLDKDGNGTVDVEEFIDFCKSTDTR